MMGNRKHAAIALAATLFSSTSAPSFAFARLGSGSSSSHEGREGQGRQNQGRFAGEPPEVSQAHCDEETRGVDNVTIIDPAPNLAQAKSEIAGRGFTTLPQTYAGLFLHPALHPSPDQDENYGNENGFSVLVRTQARHGLFRPILEELFDVDQYYFIPLETAARGPAVAASSFHTDVRDADVESGGRAAEVGKYCADYGAKGGKPSWYTHLAATADNAAFRTAAVVNIWASNPFCPLVKRLCLLTRGLGDAGSIKRVTGDSKFLRKDEVLSDENRYHLTERTPLVFFPDRVAHAGGHPKAFGLAKAAYARGRKDFFAHLGILGPRCRLRRCC
jgi:hypothetical protein